MRMPSRIRLRLHALGALLRRQLAAVYVGVLALFLATLHGGALMSDPASTVHRIGFIAGVVSAGLVLTLLLSRGGLSK